MIFGSIKNSLNPLACVGALAILLSGCGGGGTEGESKLGTTNSSQIAQVSSTPNAVASSIASSQPSSIISSTPPLTSSSAPSSSPVQTTKSSSSTPSSYARSSRANNSLDDFDEDIIYPEEDEEYFDLPPTAPRNLILEGISSNTAIISWDPATDDIALSRYEVRRDGVTIGSTTTSTLEYEDSNLSHNSYYTYTVRAIDIAGNRSNFSNALVAKTTSITTNITSSSGSSNSSTALSSSAITSSSATAISSSSSETTSSSTAAISSSSSETTSSSAATISSSSSKSTSSSVAAISSSSAANSSSSSTANLVRLEWITPSQRENGEYLELNEIGGYELRYKPINSSIYIREIITDKYATSFETTNASMEGLFQIAAFDTNGLYSRFISLSPR